MNFLEKILVYGAAILGYVLMFCGLYIESITAMTWAICYKMLFCSH